MFNTLQIILCFYQRLLTGSEKNFSNYKNLIEGVFIAPSHLSGIQLADMVAGAVFRRFVRNDDRYYKLIENAFRKSPQGSIEGYGLIRCPKVI